MLCRLCFPFLLCAGAVLLAQVPVTLESRVDSKGGGEAVIANLKAVPLTAYVIQVFLEPCSPTPRPAQFRAADATLTPGREPLPQFQSRTEPLGSAYCNKDGVSVPARAELKAAIFQDGSSFGEAQWVNSLLDSRRFQLEQIEIVLNRLKAPDAGSASRQVLTADLGERLAAAQGKNTFPFLSLLDVRELALENLKTGAEASLPDQIARAVKLFEQLRNKLLEARPSLR
jgi:hypothetical protein